MRLACWRARLRDRGLSFGAALLTRFRFRKRLFRRDAETRSPRRPLPRLWRCRRRYRSRARQITSPQFFHVWQFIEIAQSEVIEEKLRGLIEKRTPGNFGASSDFHQAAFHYCLQHTVDV